VPIPPLLITALFRKLYPTILLREQVAALIPRFLTRSTANLVRRHCTAVLFLYKNNMF
jgi:hypothetical protein